LQEVEVGGGRRAVLIFVPVPQVPQYQKMIKERSLIEELEKKFSSKQVIILAERRIIRKESRNKPQLKQKRPYRCVWRG
jgi:small subunit ribosomal protein S7e